MGKKTKKQAAAKRPRAEEVTRKEWKGMPEFVQPDARPVKNLIVSFTSNEHMHEFSKLIGQPITAKTRSVWYPAVPEEAALDKRWIE